MPDDDQSAGFSRRTYVKTIGGSITTLALAGCAGDGDGDGDTTQDDGTTGDTTGGMTSEDTTDSGDGEEQTLQIQHWWTAGGDGEAMQALIEAFEEEHPEVTVKENPVAGAGGQNLHSVIKQKVINGDPPSTWQDWPGANLLPFVEADALNTIGDTIWEKNDMKNQYLAGPKEQAQPGGEYVAVPLNIHRLNNLFYNVELVEQAGVDPSTIDSPTALVDAMATVESETDAAGMANQTSSSWSTLQMWAAVMMGQSGAETYKAYTRGEIDDSVRTAVSDALSVVKEYSNHYTSDSGSINSDQAGFKIAEGEAAFMHMGDWQAGNFGTIDGFEYKTGWNHVPFPGTEGMYALNMDGFPYPKNNPSPEATEKFLTYVGTAEAQEIFNPLKGSIPPRKDVSTEDFTEFQKQQIEDFKNSTAQPPSIAHGLAVRPSVLTNCEDAMSTFISSYDVEQTTQSLVNAVQSG